MFQYTNLSLIQFISYTHQIPLLQRGSLGEKNFKTMKKVLIISSFTTSFLALSQVIIGKSSTTTLSSTSVLLEFGDTKDKGILLPYVESVPTSASQAKGGTFIFDVSAIGEYKVKVKNENTAWTDLSVLSGYSTQIETTVKTPQASPLADNASAKAIIGDQTTTADAVLVLESADKAMVLPIVDDFKTIKNPSPGMLAFLKGATTDKQRLIVFNGQKWSFWKP